MVERVPKTARRGPDTTAPLPAPRGVVRRRASRRDGRADADAWQVTDDFSRPLLVGEAEIAVLETYLGAALDALFRKFPPPRPGRKRSL